MRKIQLYKILFLICFWECCVIFIVFYDSSLLGFKSSIDQGNYNFYVVLFTSMINCLIGATILGTMEVLLFSKLFRKKPLGITLLIKTTVYLCFILFFVSLGEIIIISSEMGKYIFSDEVWTVYKENVLNMKIIMQITYWGFCCILALFVLQVNEKFGQGVLLNFLLGRYHKPKEEIRVFMFMDLKSSTTLAERLGHMKYSKLIQDCFYDLTDIVTKYEAKIYQYVGDEVVLSWESSSGLNKENCIKTFFDYDKLLSDKKKYYSDKYGVLPQFKAGLHLGKVTVAEVGEIKKELAFHGDAINTTARIQMKCNDFNKKILISEKIKNELNLNNKYKIDFVGDVKLKGKKESTNLYAIVEVS